VFDGREGKETLADLFDGRSQLVVYHFFDANVIHLNARDMTFVAVSRAPLAKLDAYRRAGSTS